ncbi:MAG TPA: hypothetical protein DCR21_00420 [Succinivibrionaceae bacterium]|nr:hypothetical protein [Succinivibrionaceae bacterium]
MEFTQKDLQKSIAERNKLEEEMERSSKSLSELMDRIPMAIRYAIYQPSLELEALIEKSKNNARKEGERRVSDYKAKLLLETEAV